MRQSICVCPPIPSPSQHHWMFFGFSSTFEQTKYLPLFFQPTSMFMQTRLLFFCLPHRWVRSARGPWRCSRPSSGPVGCCWWVWPCPQTTGCWWRRASSCSRTRPPRSRWRCTPACGGSASWQVGQCELRWKVSVTHGSNVSALHENANPWKSTLCDVRKGTISTQNQVFFGHFQKCDC